MSDEYEYGLSPPQNAVQPLQQWASYRAPMTPAQWQEYQQTQAAERLNSFFTGVPVQDPRMRTQAGDPEPQPTKAWDSTPQLGPGEKPAGREGIYGNVYKYNYDASKQQLDDQAEKTRRNLTFALADKGLFGGSADIDANAQENRGYSNALIKAADSAQGASDAVRSGDERTRLNLLSSLRSGADEATASQSAIAQMSDNVNAGRANSTTGALDSYLASVGGIVNNQQQQAGVLQARNQYGNGGGIYGRPGNYNGQTTR